MNSKFLPTTEHELDDSLSAPTAGVLQVLRETRGTIAVHGAAGKMGFHLGRMIQRGLAELDRNEPVIAVSRFGSRKQLAKFEAAGFEVHSADLSDARQVRELPNADNVFFMAGIKFGTSGNPALLQQMNELMPRIVAERYKRSRIVALSTGCVYEFVAPSTGRFHRELHNQSTGRVRTVLFRAGAGVRRKLARTRHANVAHPPELFERVSIRRARRHRDECLNRRTRFTRHGLRERDLAERRRIARNPIACSRE